MNLIIRNAKIIDPTSSYNNSVVDIVIENGIVTNIGEALPAIDSFDEVALPNLHISQGWFDSSVSFGEPGFEDRETISNGLQVAARSGFTSVALQPNSYPVIDNQSQVGFVKSRAIGAATDLYPIGALTKKSEGKDLAELFDMANAGAKAFGDYNQSIDNANLLKIALQYVQDFNGLVIAFSEDQQIKGSGIVNEGIVSTSLGLKGIPALAEEIQIARNLFILEYTGGKLHVPTISTSGSVILIREAKAKGLDVSCSVAVHNLVLTDSQLVGFDTRFKVSPPLRTEDDRSALLAAVIDGTIDLVTSDHNPIDIEHKKMEFDGALPGTIGLESAFGALNNILPIDVVVRFLSSGRQRFGIPEPKLELNHPASLTLFNPDEDSVFLKHNILSKSKNSAFVSVPIKGRVYGILNNNQLILQ